MTSAAPGFAFVDGALDRADALRDDTDALLALWPHARILLLDDDGRALADGAGAMFAPTGGELGGGPGTGVFLGLRDGVAWFAQRAATASPALLAAAPRRIDLRSAAAAWPARDATACVSAEGVKRPTRMDSVAEMRSRLSAMSKLPPPKGWT